MPAILGCYLNNCCLKNNYRTKCCVSQTILSTFQCLVLKWQTEQLNVNDSSWSDYFLPSNLLFIISLHIKEAGGNTTPEHLSLCLLGTRFVRKCASCSDPWNRGKWEEILIRRELSSTLQSLQPTPLCASLRDPGSTNRRSPFPVNQCLPREVWKEKCIFLEPGLITCSISRMEAELLPSLFGCSALSFWSLFSTTWGFLLFQPNLLSTDYPSISRATPAWNVESM